MRDFSKVSPRVWRDKRFLSLGSSDAQLVVFYLMTNEHQNSAGCYRLPLGYATSDLQWDDDRFQQAFSLVIDAGIVLFDEETDELFMPDWFQDNPAMNNNHAKGIANTISRLSSNIIREVAEEVFFAAEEMRTKKPANDRPANSPNLANTGYLNRRGRA